MSLVQNVRNRFTNIQQRGIRKPMISTSALGSQPYDPELGAIDPLGLVESRRRLGLGFGAPPVHPYGQRARMLSGLGLRLKLLQTFPVLGTFPNLKKMLEA